MTAQIVLPDPDAIPEDTRCIDGIHRNYSGKGRKKFVQWWDPSVWHKPEVTLTDDVTIKQEPSYKPFFRAIDNLEIGQSMPLREGSLILTRVR